MYPQRSRIIAVIEDTQKDNIPPYTASIIDHFLADGLQKKRAVEYQGEKRATAISLEDEEGNKVFVVQTATLHDILRLILSDESYADEYCEEDELMTTIETIYIVDEDGFYNTKRIGKKGLKPNPFKDHLQITFPDYFVHNTCDPNNKLGQQFDFFVMPIGEKSSDVEALKVGFPIQYVPTENPKIIQRQQDKIVELIETVSNKNIIKRRRHGVKRTKH